MQCGIVGLTCALAKTKEEKNVKSKGVFRYCLFAEN